MHNTYLHTNTYTQRHTCIWKHMRAHTFTHAHKYKHMDTNTEPYTYTYIYPCAHRYTRIYGKTSTLKYMCTPKQGHMCTHIHMHTNMHTYMHMKTHIHSRIQCPQGTFRKVLHTFLVCVL